MRIEVSEKRGALSFGVFWVSLDGRFQTEWFQKYKTALKHYLFLKQLKREPSLNLRLEDPK